MDIPSAKIFSQEIEKNIARSITKYDDAANMFVTTLTSVISGEIRKALTDTRFKFDIEIKDNLLQRRYSDIVAYDLWYGRITNSADSRALLRNNQESFILEKLQRIFAEYGYVVFEITGPYKSSSASHVQETTIIRVYSHFPEYDEDEYFNKPDLLCHNNNMWLLSKDSVKNIDIIKPNNIEEPISNNDECNIKSIKERFFLKRGANINADDNIALRIAAKRGLTDMIKLLLHHGANIHAKNDEALLVAFENNHFSASNLLLEWGASIAVFIITLKNLKKL